MEILLRLSGNEPASFDPFRFSILNLNHTPNSSRNHCMNFRTPDLEKILYLIYSVLLKIVPQIVIVAEKPYFHLIYWKKQGFVSIVKYSSFISDAS
jgi:hypothetical protein